MEPNPNSAPQIHSLENSKVQEKIYPPWDPEQNTYIVNGKPLKKDLLSESPKFKIPDLSAKESDKDAPIVLIDSPRMPNIEIDSTISLEVIERRLEVVDPTISETGVEVIVEITKAEYQKLRETARAINQYYKEQGKPLDELIMFRLEYAFHHITKILKQEIDGCMLWILAIKIRVRVAKAYYDDCNNKKLETQGTPFHSEEILKMTQSLHDAQANYASLVQYMKDQGIEEEIVIKPACFSCCNVPVKEMRCGGCKIAIYCNTTCQRDDWMRHKCACKGGDAKDSRLLAARQVTKANVENFIYENPTFYQKFIDTARDQDGIPVLLIELGGGAKPFTLNNPKKMEVSPGGYGPMTDVMSQYEEIYKKFKKIKNCLLIIIVDPKYDAIVAKKNKEKGIDAKVEKSLVLDYISVEFTKKTK